MIRSLFQIFKLLGIYILIFGSIGLKAQDDPNLIDLGIRFITTPPPEVKINEVFGVQAEVYLDTNSSNVPAGETVTAEVTLVDPDGIIIQTVTQTWDGFTAPEPIENYPDQLLLQVPWSQANKWSETAKWKIVLHLTASSVESDASDNISEHLFDLLLPDLSLSIDGVTATDPLTGSETDNFVPNTNYTVRGTLSNVGQVMTQPSVKTSIVAQLRQLNEIAAGQYALGDVIDEQAIVFPSDESPTLYLPANGSALFKINNLFLPADANGKFIVTVEVNSADVPGGRIMNEMRYDNNLRVHPSTSTDIDADGEIDYFEGAVIDVSPGDENATILPRMAFVSNSYNGDRGTFRGVDPVFISFAIRNEGARPVAEEDDIKAKVFLSKNLEVDETDFLIREFNLGGKGIGLNMLAGETINLSWFQSLPDNFEGDYYLLIDIKNPGLTNELPIPADLTPIFTLSTQGKGRTDILSTDNNLNRSFERPSISKDGSIIVYEQTDEHGIHQIYMIDRKQVPLQPILISKSYQSTSNQDIAGNNNSYRPRISSDGKKVTFHSRASNLAIGDTNEKEDIFLYDLALNTMVRPLNGNNEQLNGRSLYPAINGDGTKIVFESDSSNTGDTLNPYNQIYLWTIDPVAGGTVRALTNGNGNSYNPSIDEIGNRIVFDTFATNLLDNGDYTNGMTITSDTNNLRDVYLIDLQSNSIFLASVNFTEEQAEGGFSMSPKISGNGERIVFESKAQNLISEAGIAKVVVNEGGFGYAGSPTIEIFDNGFNVDGAKGRGAVLTVKPDGINELSEIKDDAIIVIEAGLGYIEPAVRIVPDPAHPLPSFEAQATAYLSNPDGDVYFIDVADLNGSNVEFKMAQRISESIDNEIGGNFASREPSISFDGKKIVYSTKSSNLLPESITRDDNKVFYNSTFQLPTASAILVGSIHEIEITNAGSGYTSGFLNIEDLSGIGFGAEASYEVDQRGRIVSIDVINGGQNYRLETTRISVSEPLGGSGFVAGDARFVPTQGLGETRSGGGRIYKVEMSDYGLGYKIGDTDESSFADLIQFEGDGADLNGDGFPDGRLNPDRVHSLNGSLYLEQRFDIEILSGVSGFVGSDILNTTLTISDNNNSLEPLVIEFAEGSSSGSDSIVIPISLGTTTLTDVRDELVDLIDNYMTLSSSSDVTTGPVVDNNVSNGNTFTFSALSGRFSTNNPSAIQVVEQSNMRIMGSGYTKVTPVVNQVPSIFGFSETLSNPSYTFAEGAGRMTLLASEDVDSDDIYLFDEDAQTNQRISVSTFGTPAGYLSNGSETPAPPSSRFPMISGNGRYVVFSSDVWGIGGLAFETSNQVPLVSSAARNIYLKDLKSLTDQPSTFSLDLLFPSTDETFEFAPQAKIPLVVDFDYNGEFDLSVYLNRKRLNDSEIEVSRFGGGDGSAYNTKRFTAFLDPAKIKDLNNSGDFTLELVAFGEGNSTIAVSQTARFVVKQFSGSLPPRIKLSTPRDAVTSSSTLPINAFADDPDGAIKEVKFFANGKQISVNNQDQKSLPRTPGVTEDTMIYGTLLDINELIVDGNYSLGERGIISLFAVAIDQSNNQVTSSIFNLSYTKGDSKLPNAEIRLNGDPADVNTSNEIDYRSLQRGSDYNLSLNNITGGIEEILFEQNLKFLGAKDYRLDIFSMSSTPGTGASFTLEVDENGSLSATKVLSGEGYSDDSNTSLRIVPIYRAYNEGRQAKLVPNELGTAMVILESPDGTKEVGNGYSLYPRARPLPSNDFPDSASEVVSLEEVEDSDISSTIDPGFIIPPEKRVSLSYDIFGGFTQSPLVINVEATKTSEEIESVSLIIDGSYVDQLIKQQPDNEVNSTTGEYYFSWVPEVPKDYMISAVVQDVGGNIVATEPNIITVANYKAGGIRLSHVGDNNLTAESDDTVLLSVNVESQFDIDQVDFFIDDRWVGSGENKGGSNFQKGVALKDFEFRPGEYEVSYRAIDVEGNMAGTFSPFLTSINYRKNKTLIITPPSSPPDGNITLVSPGENLILPEGSTIRVLTIASDRSGDLSGVHLYNSQGDSPLYAWQQVLDFNNSLPADEKLLIVKDGTGKSFTFEFDDNSSAAALYDIPEVVPGAYNELNDFNITSVSFTKTSEVSYLIEIDGKGNVAKGTKDSYKYSIDGGRTFVGEKIPITAGVDTSLSQGFGVQIRFENDVNHALGDRWSFVLRPQNRIVSIEDDHSSPEVNRLITRNNLLHAFNEAENMGLLSIHASVREDPDLIYLRHLNDLVYTNVDLNGSSLQKEGGNIVLHYDQNDTSGENVSSLLVPLHADSKKPQPFGITWEVKFDDNTSALDKDGNEQVYFYAISKDNSGQETITKSTRITIVPKIGSLPAVELDEVVKSMVYSGTSLQIPLSAEATDPDGTIAEVSFYGNGVLIESDSSRPYSANFEINATGHYEVYAVARDNSGNLVTSNVRRIIVDEGGEEPEQPLVLSAPSAYLGGVGEISGTYKPESGSYDSNIRALVYIDGSYAGDADLLPRTPPGPGEEDPGQSFTYDLLARNLSGYDVEFIIINGNETASTDLQLEVKASPLSDDYEFLKALWNGLFDRNPVGAEINAYLAGLRNGSMTRSLVLNQLRTREEFITARDILLTHKTLQGVWEELPIVLGNTDQEGYDTSSGSSSASAQAANGMPYIPEDGNFSDLGFYDGVVDDHANFASQGTWISMNEAEAFAIKSYQRDADFFKIKSNNLADEGILWIEQNRAPFGELVSSSISGAAGSRLSVHFMNGESILVRPNTSVQGRGREKPLMGFILSYYKNVDYYSFSTISTGNGTLGATIISTYNQSYLNQENFLSEEEIAQLQIDSRVNGYDQSRAIRYQTNNFLYFDQYGAIGTHNPEEFFTRLFRNKYEQDAGPVQIARGLELLNNASDLNDTGTGFSQLDFLSNFALDNAILSVGPYNYTHNLAIPNVPLDAAAFAETALVYSALIGRAPTKAEVAKLTLTPQYELRPLAQRARMIMEMPDYAARYGLAMPEVAMPNLRNGREYDPGDSILIDATSLGADNLAGTVDDGKIREIEVYLNGILQGSLSGGVVTAGTRYEFYQFNIPIDQPAGEYLVEVLAEDIGGLQSRASASIVLRSSIDVDITSPALGEKLYWNENVDFMFSSNSLDTVKSYLEVNGAIPWRGRLTFDGSDLPEDNSTLFMQDGTGRDPVVFEFDSDGSPGVSPISTLVEMNAVKTGNVSLSGTYMGTQARTYLIEIDSTSGPKDTFRWSIDGGANFNNSLIEITAGTPHSLSGGLAVIFAGDTNNTVGDRWRIEVQPQRHIVEVGRYGTFRDRLLTTKQNLIGAINQVFNSGKLAIRAKSGQSGVSGGGGFGQYYDDYTIELCLDWVCGLIEDIVITPEDETTLLYNEDLPLITTTGTGSDQTFTLDVNKWLSPGTSMVKTRVVSIETGSGNVSYSSPRFYEVRNPHRPYVDLIYPQGRKAVLRFKETFSGGGLDASQIEIVDPGLGYEEESVHFSFLTADGYGGELNATLDEQGGISEISVVSSGFDYAQGDVIMASAPFRYRVGEEITVRAKLHDPLGETQGVTFFSNGVEIMEPVEQYGNERVISFTPANERSSFICGQPFFGGGQDLPPRVMPDGSLDCDYSGKEHDRSGGDWGWRRCWEQQHCHPGQYVAPPWFWGELGGYWQWPPPWLSVDSIPGGLPIQPLPSSVTAAFINPSWDDPSFNRFTLGTEVEIAVSVAAEVGTVEQVRLFLDGKLLDLPVRFPQADPSSPLGGYSRDGIYGYVWTPDRPGTYELSVQAMDNAGGVSEFTEKSTAKVTIGADPLGIPPVVRMTEPVPGGFGDTYPDYSYGSELFINVLAYDPDGDLEYVKIFLNGEELGEAQGRYGDTYIYKWEVATRREDSQLFVLQAVAKDNDGNIVRSATLGGITADNSGNTRPKVEIDNIFVDNEGVKLRALAEARESEFWGGISRVQFFINGVTLDAVGGQGTFFADGLSEYSMSWVPESPGIYTIYAMAVGSVGHFGDHYTMSDPYVFEVTEEHLALFSSPNAGPYVSLISPGPHVEGQAIAVANLDESLLPNDPDYGRLKSISMISFGEGYHADPLPEIEIFGGGGMGAQASAEISNGAVTNITLSGGGSSYTDDLELEISGVIASGSDLELEPIIENGVITEIPILEGGMGYSHNDLVTIFSLQNGINAGYGARASVEVDENGSITKLNILNGGQNYDPNYLRVFIISNGSGFEADINNAVILNGVVTKINIIDPGKDYIADKNYTLIPKSGTGGTGTGLDATILASDIIDGAVVARITNFGQGYSYPPSVLITGGKTDSFSSPFVFTQGSLVTLEAEAYDADGNVDEVRFYGNGRLLGSAPPGNIDSLQIIDFGEPRSFGTTPPTVSFIGGGPGIGAEAAAIIDENGTLIGIQITSGGIDYTSPPAVVLSPSNGAAVVATIDDVVRNNARKIPGTNRWVVDWNTELSGTFNISVEAIDNELKSTRISTNRYITIIPQSSSKTPRAVNLGPPDLRTYTSGSKLKLYAQATDLDGSLEWVQFYINGEPYGDPIPGNRDMRSASFPYSIDWVVPAPGVYSFFTRAMDNSKNGVMSSISTITATTGIGNLPNVDFFEPLRVAQAKAEVDSNGSITGFKQPIDGGFGYVKEPEVLITGGDENASARAVIDKNKSSASFGHVLNIELIDGGSGYDENTSVSLMKGFPLIKPGGETAIVELVLEPIVKQGGGAENQPVFYVLDGGSGYTEPPEVVIEGLGTGMTAEAVIDVDLGIVTEVIPTNLGSGYYQTGNKVILRGGFPLETRSFKVSADDEDGSIEEVTLFVNGRPLQRDRFAPYDFEWSVGSAGFYDIYFEALDNQGNRNLSPVMRREVFYSEAPQFHLQPASPARVSTMIDANGSWPTGELEIDYAGSGYHVPPTIHFIDPEGAGSGALGYAYLTEDQVTKVVIYDGGSGYSPNSVIRLVGGLDTSVDQIRLEMGKTLPLSIYAYDPDTMINQTGFVLEVNGEEIELFITGSDPYFSFLWTPEVPGDYNIRVRGSSIDRTEGYTQNLDVEVYHNSENSVKILTNFALNQINHVLGNTSLLPFEIDSKFGTVEEIRVFDNGVEVASYPSQAMNNLSYEPGSGFFNFSWVPNYTGNHEITVSVKFESGLYVFSDAHRFEVVEGVKIIISPNSEALNTQPYSFLLHEQCTKVGVEVELAQGAKPKLSQAFLYGNEIFLSQKTFSDDFDYQYNTSGITTANIAWNFDWNVSYRDFVDLPLDENQTAEIDLQVIVVTQADMSIGLQGQQLVSNTVPVRIRALSIGDEISQIALQYFAVKNERVCDILSLYSTPPVPSPIDDDNGTDPPPPPRPEDYLVTDGDVDLLGVNVVLYGEILSPANFRDESNIYQEEFNSDLLSYIIDKLSSDDPEKRTGYSKIFDDRNHLLGTREGDYYRNRINFVNYFFNNKYGRLPYTIQADTGATKIWLARDLGEVGAAADFIFNLVREPTIPAVYGSPVTYLPNMVAHREIWYTHVYNLLNSVDDSNSTDKNNRVGQIQMLNVDTIRRSFLNSSYYRQKLNLLWADSTKSDVSDSWKYEDWFGWFTDEAFPWIYHTDLGWLYSQSNSQNSIWFFSEQLGWFWTNEETFKDHPSLAEDQRFIFRVRAGNPGGWEGSWSLITLPSEANDRDSIYLFDYGYSPL